MGSTSGAVESWLGGNENKLSRLIGFFSRKGLVVRVSKSFARLI
jgi:hypothetical protein